MMRRSVTPFLRPLAAMMLSAAALTSCRQAAAPPAPAVEPVMSTPTLTRDKSSRSPRLGRWAA